MSAWLSRLRELSHHEIVRTPDQMLELTLLEHVPERLFLDP
jgi:hypothetical protein